MKKIMFNDKYGLTHAVLEGTKTMTRRLMNPQPWCWAFGGIPHSSDMKPIMPAYKVGEVVAVSQAYRDISQFNPEAYEDVMLDQGTICEASHPYSHLMRSGGWDNKMFVKAELMPHYIQITDIDVQLLHDISDEDCLREGIMRKWIEAGSLYHYYLPGVPVKSKHDVYSSPCDAFAALIDKISGKGTWYRNPWVFVYAFELVK